MWVSTRYSPALSPSVTAVRVWLRAAFGTLELSLARPPPCRHSELGYTRWPTRSWEAVPTARELPAHRNAVTLVYRTAKFQPCTVEFEELVGLLLSERSAKVDCRAVKNPEAGRPGVTQCRLRSCAHVAGAAPTIAGRGQLHVLAQKHTSVRWWRDEHPSLIMTCARVRTEQLHSINV